MFSGNISGSGIDIFYESGHALFTIFKTTVTKDTSFQFFFCSYFLKFAYQAVNLIKTGTMFWI